MFKARVTFNWSKQRWEVYETQRHAASGKWCGSIHHSFHRTQADAKAAAAAQNRINRREAAKAAEQA